MEVDPMKTGQTTAVYFISKVVGAALGFAGTVYFARILGAEVLGHYFLVLALTGWLGIVGELGVTKAITKRLSEGDEPSAYFTAGAVSMVVFAVFVAAGVLLFSPFINSYIGTTAASYVALLLFPMLFVGLVDAALQGQHLVHISGILSTVRIGVRSLLQIALVLAGFQLVGMVAGYVLGVVLIGLLGMRYLTVQYQRPTLNHFRRLFSFAKYAWLGSVRGRAYSEMDILVLGAFISSSLVGVYSVAWSLAAFLSLFGKSIMSAIFPEISKQDVEQNQEAIRDLATEGLGFAGLITIPGLVGGLLLADQLLLIYGTDFTRGSAVLPVLIGAVLINEYQSQCMNVLNAIDRPDLSFKVNAAFLGSNLILNIILIWQYKMIGAAFATLISASLGLILSFWLVSRQVKFRIPITRIIQQGKAAIAMGILVYAGQGLFEILGITENTTFVLMALVPVGGVSYFGILYAISIDFRNSITRNIDTIFS